ncbi:MAG: hypothetical protein EPN60_02650 [Nevskiaceae bacterium]|nr:MAG: hypothetical protein EPO48_09270 [Nevskiaceae bacterium]TAM32985.1 MAG: hypothetical protein EPN60_02650 [Nevskiaceae bacterium]
MTCIDWSELIRNYATAIGIVVGGGWAFWKWGYSEWAGAKKNRASLDGQLSCSSVPLPGSAALVTVQAHWCNRGSFPVPIDPKETKVLVFKLPTQLQEGPFEPSSGFGPPLFDQRPFSSYDEFELEPKTESSLRAHFVLESDCTYFFRWELQKQDDGKASHVFTWSKEIVWQVPSNRALQPTGPASGGSSG